MAEDPEILAAVEAEKERLRRIEAHAKRLFDYSESEGLETLMLLLQARVMFAAMRDRPGITWKQIEQFLEQVDALVGLGASSNGE